MHKSLRLPLFLMNIVLYSPVLEHIDKSRFIVETFFLLAEQHPEHRFIIITDQKPAEHFSFYSNIQYHFEKPLSKNPLLKKVWWDIKLRAILKKVKADLFISFHNACSLIAVI